VRTGAKTVTEKTVTMTAPAPATPIAIDRTTRTAPGTDSVATAKIATHDSL
jgi:hypothetical protein